MIMKKIWWKEISITWFCESAMNNWDIDLLENELSSLEKKKNPNSTHSIENIDFLIEWTRYCIQCVLNKNN